MRTANELAASGHNALSERDSFAAKLEPIVVTFARNARGNPDKPAAIAPDEQITYGDLNLAANRLAHKILASIGRREEPVAYLSGLEIDSLTAVLGILKSAKIYVGLDPSNPPDRLRAILEDTGARMLVTNQANLGLARKICGDQIQIINLDTLESDLPSENPDSPVSLNTLAAIYYTSGSTGKPKGLVHDHRSLAYSNARAMHRLGHTSEDRILLGLSLAFAQGIVRAHLAFVAGSTLYLRDYKSTTLPELANWLTEKEITVMPMTASLFSQFLASIPEDFPSKFPSLRLINIGGEAFNPQDLEAWKRRFSPHCWITSSLASTEAGSITSTVYTFQTQFVDGRLPHGKIADGTKVLILDDANQPVSLGEMGRIAVNSPTMARGYWRRPDLDERLFIPDPENPQEMIAVTSDLGRVHRDGTLEFLGRGDAMLKVRGFRVEPGEIESALRAHPAIQNAAVAGRRSSPEQSISLIAYIIVKPGLAVTAKDLRDFLSPLVPHYMIPAYYLFLSELPRTLSGKIDRQGLPDPDWSNSETRDLQAPRTVLEKSLTDLWAKVLGKEQIGITDDFFMLGGHSLAAFRITANIQETMGLKLPLQVLISHPTIQALAKVIEAKAQQVVMPSSLTVIREPSGGASLFVVPGVARTSMGLNKLAQSLDTTLGVYGLEYPGMDGYLDPIDDTEKLANFFADQILAVQQQGPYVIAGQCHGGVTAFETARQLSARGHKIDLVVLLDSSPPGMRDDELDGREPTYYLKRLMVMLEKENRANLIPFVADRLRRTKFAKSFQKRASAKKSENELPQLSWTENELDQASLRVAYAARKARDTYTPQKLHTRGLALMSSMARGSARETWWNRLFDELECHYIPGTTHANIFSAEHSRKLTGELISKAVLRQSK